MLRAQRTGPVVLAAGCLVTACAGGNAASQLAKAPEFQPKDQTKCSVEKSQAKPLIVEWPSADRGELEAHAHNRGIIVVRYQACEMKVLDRCTAPVKYGYAAITRKKDRVVMRDADDLYANVPVGAAKLEAKLQKSGELDVDMMLVGRWEAERSDLRADELQGECDGATHLVVALTVGSFTFTARADATVGGEATVLGAGAGASSSANRETLNADGDETACEKATPDDKAPPAQCGAPLRGRPRSPRKSVTVPSASTRWSYRRTWGCGWNPVLVVTVRWSRSTDSTSRTWSSVLGKRRRIGLTTSSRPMVPVMTSGSSGWKTKWFSLHTRTASTSSPARASSAAAV